MMKEKFRKQRWDMFGGGKGNWKETCLEESEKRRDPRTDLTPRDQEF